MKKQILIDISYFVQEDRKTGIYRVLRSILLELLQNPPKEYSVRPIYAVSPDSGFFYANTCIYDRFSIKLGIDDTSVYYRKGDIFIVGLDFSTHSENFYSKITPYIINNGVKIYTVLYDLLPIELPHMYPQYAVNIFNKWLHEITQFNGVICASKSTASVFQTWANKNNILLNSSFTIDWFHLGSDVENSAPTLGLPKDGQNILPILEKKVTILMVGSLKPRKGYSQVLKAFEELWKRNIDINLVIVGKYRYNMDNVVLKIKENKEFCSRLFWLDHVSDEYLEKLYEVSTVVLMAAEEEGFGLPIVEAARYKKPLILRNIPVFKEIAENHAFFFSGLEPSDLATAIEHWLTLYSEGMVPTTEGMKILTWKESTEQLLNKLLQ